MRLFVGIVMQGHIYNYMFFLHRLNVKLLMEHVLNDWNEIKIKTIGKIIIINVQRYIITGYAIYRCNPLSVGTAS